MANIIQEFVDYFSSSRHYWLLDHVLPGSMDSEEIKRRVFREVLSPIQGKIKIIFIIHDDPLLWDFKIQNAVVFKTSILKSKQKLNEFVLPYVFEPSPFSHDVLPRDPRGPRLGFCGWGGSHVTRFQTLKYFLLQSDIRCDFDIQDKFWGGRPNCPKLIERFFLNVNNSEFHLCPRGGGNFSMRFYQAISSGRIPVLLDTDIALPYDDEIDYNSFCVIGDTLDRLKAGIIRVWESDRIEEMQRRSFATHQRYFLSDVAPAAMGSFLERHTGLPVR